MATTLLILSIVTNSTNQSLLEEAQAAPVTLTVDSTADTGDATPGDDICDDGAGNCTLRAAIEEANGDVDTDTIQFNIPVTDPNHLCYADDSTPGTVNPANEEVTTTQDACSSGSTIDPDHAFTWFRVSPVTDLAVTQPVDIQGYTQTGAAANTTISPAATDAVLKIQIMGDTHGTPASGILLALNTGSDNSTVRGLVVSGDATAFQIYIVSDNTVVAGNYLGLDPSGLLDASLSSLTRGVESLGSDNTTIGGGAPADRNVVGGSAQQGVVFDAATNSQIAGNYIGTDKTGLQALPNGGGVTVKNLSSGNTVGTDGDGLSDATEGNLISGNNVHAVGVAVTSDNNTVAGNYIGVDAAGATILSNTGTGVQIQNTSNNNTIGTDGDGLSDTEERNVISGNLLEGVRIRNTSSGNTVAGNYIGTDVNGTIDLGNTLEGVSILAGSGNNTIGTNGDGAFDTEERNIISGNDGDGVLVSGAGTDSNEIAGNYIGTDASGTIDLGNMLIGVSIDSTASNNLIGTDGDGANDTSERNVISGNNNHGVRLNGLGTTINVAAGNYIGTDFSGGADLGNSLEGVVVDAQASGNTIGVTDDSSGGESGEGNVISGNNRYGVNISNSTNIVAGNIVGLNASGDADIGNSNIGIIVDNGSTSTVIGTDGDGQNDTAEANTVSGNDSHGVLISGVGTDNNIVAGNNIGTNVAGDAGIAGGGSGIFINASAANNTIGTNADGTSDTEERNIVSGNDTIGVAGIAVYASNNDVYGNYVGVSADGNSAIPNHIGIAVGSGPTTGINVGGPLPVQRNIVSASLAYGISDLGGNNKIQNNYVGTNASGTAMLGNGTIGIAAQGPNSIVGTDGDGTDDANEGNLVSGNGSHGIQVNLAGTNGARVSGNLIGTDMTGALDFGNALNGVYVLGGADTNIIGTDGDGISDTEERNVISGNDSHGVSIVGVGTDSNIVAGNYIGTDINGTADVGNGVDGVSIQNGPDTNIVGTNSDGSGDSIEGNLLSGNGRAGALIFGLGTEDNIVAGNLIGTDVTGGAGLGNSQSGILIGDSSINTRVGVDADGASDIEERNIISSNANHGISVSSAATTGVVIAGNYIGTDITGAIDLGNALNGVQYSGDTSGNLLGTNGDGLNDSVESNIISGNTQNGVYISGTATSNNRVSGNMIGTDITGAVDLGNTLDGVMIDLMSTSNTVGVFDDGSGGETNEGNLISGNNRYGVHLFDASSNTVAGNYIGTNASGSAVLGNNIGLRLEDADNNTIGTDSDGSSDTEERNIVSGNTSHAFHLRTSDLNTVAGNYIGTDVTGSTDVGNGADGFNIRGSSSNTIGTNGDGTNDDIEGNVISGNGDEGVTLFASSNSNMISGNTIGADATQTIQIGNDSYGVYLDDTSSGIINNTVGSNNDGTSDNYESNFIFGNAFDGVRVEGDTTDNNSILSNQISNNGGIGIDHVSYVESGADLNDAGDTDTGSNDGLNYPIILNNSPSHPNYPIATTNPAIDVYLDIDTTETTNFLVQLYDNPSGIDASGHGEGEVFIGNANVTAAPGGITTTLNFTGTISDPANIALAITEDLGGGNYGSTSEFSSPHAQGLSGRVFNDFFYDSDDDGQAIDNGYNNVTLDIYHDDGDDIFDSLTDRLVNQVTTANNAANGGEDGEYNALVSSAGDFWVHNTDTSAVIPVTLNPAGPNIEAASTTPATTGDWTVPFGDLTQVSFGYGETLPDADGDNTPTIIEDAGPNSGDANNDGTLDSQQANVASAPNTNSPSYNASGSTPEEQSYTALALNTAGSTCDTIDNLGFVTEASLTNQDTDYDYPIGLIDFTLTCSTNGDTASITYILDTNYDTTDWVWRKYNPITNQYQDMSSSVTFGTTTIAGTTKTTATFQVTDGQNLDDDALANGTILDPSGPAVQVEGLSETGSTTAYMAPVAGTTIALLAIGTGVRIRRKTFQA